ncbi:HigA family addiction module antitoxin [Niastella yeongjuensis]|nr:HigA family addiction module antitoxin [Niastella yeongjuensis]SEP18811.1 HTH-type transcriptional regulator / antitoxin HigA [Niastella yeongjuensis]
MSIKLSNLTPSIAIHPGELLKDELDSRGIKQKEFSELIGVQATQLNEIINGKRGINAEMALLFGKALNMDVSIWINLQNNYELDLARINEKVQKRLMAIEQWLQIQQRIPEKYLKKKGYLKGNPIHDIDTIKTIYNLNNIDQLLDLDKEASFYKLRKSSTVSIDSTNLIAWTKLVNYEASKLKVEKFNKQNVNTLVTKLKDVFWKNKNTVSKTKNILSEFGIKLIILENPEKCPIDGYTYWNKSNPVIGLTLSHNRIDYFAYTLFHELGHVYLHVQNNKSTEFVDLESDNISSDQNKEENEADSFANDHLINPENWKEFIKSPIKNKEESIIYLAKKEKIHPAIIKSRLSFELNNRIKAQIDHTIY